VLLAVEYGRPIIAYGPALERAVPLDPRVARAASVAELEALLTTALGLADSSIR